MTSEPPNAIDTKHTSPLTTVIAPIFDGTTAAAGDLPEPDLLGLGLLDVGLMLELPRLLLLEEQEPRWKVGDGIELIVCAVPVPVTGKFFGAFPIFVCTTGGPRAVDEAPGIAEPVISVIFDEVALKLVWAIAIWSSVRSYTTYAERRNVVPR